MFQATAWTGGKAVLAGLAIAALLVAPGAVGDDLTPPDPEATVETTLVWLDDRMQRAERQVNPEEGRAEEDGEEPASEEPSSHDDDHVATTQTWAEAQASKAQHAAADKVGLAVELVDQLNREAEHQVTQTHTFLATLTAGDDGSGAEESNTQGAAVEEAPSNVKAVMMATVAAAATAGSLFAMFWTAGSTAGSAGAAASAKSSTAGLKRVAPVFSPLFTRFEGREVLKHPNRAELYGLISGNPGVRLQDLCVETALSRTAVTHHLRLLEQQHLIVSERVGRSRHYYENGGRYEREKKDAYAVLQNERSRDIAHYIMSNPGTIQKNLCEALDVRASIAHWHIKRLQEASLVDCIRQGRTVSYYPAGTLAKLGI